jgi:hypothetical protein
MRAGSWELVTAAKSTVVTESSFDPSVVEGLEGNRCLVDLLCADESDGLEIFSESDDRSNQLVTS